jgi:hypothetical protein
MLSKEKMLEYLRQLGSELSKLGMKGEILLTGGAAMCLVHSARDMTKDIDALYEPKSIINKIAAGIAEREGLAPDWLNDGVKGFVGANAPTEEFVTFDGLRVQTVSAEYLLAMKLMSARYGETDYKDIRFLLSKMSIATVEAATEVLLSYFPQARVLPKTQYVLEELIGPMTKCDDGRLQAFDLARKLLSVEPAIITDARPNVIYENQIIGLTEDCQYAIMRISANQAVIHTLAPGETPPEVGKIVALAVDSNWLSTVRNKDNEQEQARGIKR